MKPDMSNDLKTLSEVSNSLKQHGYEKDFVVDEKGLRAMDAEETFSPEEIKIVNFYRFEGESDPGDMSVLYVIETNTGLKGTLVDGFGTYSTRKVSEFIKQVEDIHKKTERTEHDVHKHDADHADQESHVSIGGK